MSDFKDAMLEIEIEDANEAFKEIELLIREENDRELLAGVFSDADIIQSKAQRLSIRIKEGEDLILDSHAQGDLADIKSRLMRVLNSIDLVLMHHREG